MLFTPRCLLAGLVLAMVPITADESWAASPNLADVREKILRSTNQFRVQEGRQELKANPELSKAAQAFAEFMARTDKYGHDADGKQPSERITDAGYEYCAVAENIAYEYNPAEFTNDELAQGLMEGWKNSPHHRANMLNPDLDDIGVGIAHSTGSGKYYAVQDFGRPKSKIIEFTITNKTGSKVPYTVDGQDFAIEPSSIMTHQACTSPEVHFPLTGKSDTAASDKGRVFHPAQGTHLVISRDEDGRIAIQTQ